MLKKILNKKTIFLILFTLLFFISFVNQKLSIKKISQEIKIKKKQLLKSIATKNSIKIETDKFLKEKIEFIEIKNKNKKKFMTILDFICQEAIKKKVSIVKIVVKNNVVIFEAYGKKSSFIISLSETFTKSPLFKKSTIEKIEKKKEVIFFKIILQY